MLIVSRYRVSHWGSPPDGGRDPAKPGHALLAVLVLLDLRRKAT